MKDEIQVKVNLRTSGKFLGLLLIICGDLKEPATDVSTPTALLLTKGQMGITRVSLATVTLDTFFHEAKS